MEASVAIDPEQSLTEDLTSSNERGLTFSGHFLISRNGLKVLDTPDFDHCAIFGTRLGTVEHALSFAVGDFINYCEKQFGERASQIIDRETFSESSIKVFAWVARQVPIERRSKLLSFKHHQAIAALPPLEQEEWIKKAENDGDPWPVSKLEAELRAGELGSITARWLVVGAKDLKDLEELRARMEGEGRNCKVQEKRERKKKKKEITAKAKRPNKRRARSKG